MKRIITTLVITIVVIIFIFLIQKEMKNYLNFERNIQCANLAIRFEELNNNSGKYNSSQILNYCYLETQQTCIGEIFSSNKIDRNGDGITNEYQIYRGILNLLNGSLVADYTYYKGIDGTILEEYGDKSIVQETTCLK